MFSFETYQVAEVQLSYKNEPDLLNRPIIRNSADAYAILLQAWDKDKIGFVEQAKVLLLNRANRVLGICDMGTGGMAGVGVDPKLVFMAAFKAAASSIVLAHNHPSENLKPSEADKRVTGQIKQAGQFLEITLLDHLIVAPNGYYSFSEQREFAIDEVQYAFQIEAASKSKLSRKQRHTVNQKNQLQIFDETKKRLERKPIRHSDDAYAYVCEMWQEDAIQLVPGFKLLLLDNDRQILGLHPLYLSKADSCFHDANKAVATAGQAQAEQFIIVHSKQYGVLLPTQANLSFVNALKQAGEENDIRFIDYMLINDKGYYSYSDNEFRVRNRPKPD